MAGGTHSKTQTGYFETEYFQPWPGIDVSKPASQIEPGACVSATGMVIRGGLTQQPAILAPIGSGYPIILPTFAPGEIVALDTNLNGVSVLITNVGVYTDFSTATSTTKTFASIFTFPTPYSQAVHFGSVVIGDNLYFSSAEQLGVYELSFTHDVIALFVTSGGSGYTSTPGVTISGGGGSGATGTATVMGATSPGEVTSYNIVSAGAYGPGTTVTVAVTGGGGMGATAVVTLRKVLSLFVVDTVTPTNFGSGYTSTPTVTVSFTGSQVLPAVITANVGNAGGYVSSLTLTNGGSGFTSPPEVTIAAPTSGATATGVAVLGPSTGLSVAEISAHNGSGPFIGGDFLATIAQRLILFNIIGGDGNQTGIVSSVAIVAGGTGYPNTGTVAFSGGGGQNAAGTFAASGGVINSIAITNPGSGYTSAPTPSIVAATGSGFVGTTTLSFAVNPSTFTKFPDYIAWSAANAYGYFDPNAITEAGGFDQLTEARGKGTGIAVFDNVMFAAHLGGFTQVTVNINGSNIEPFSYNPLWSSDQGVICRYGSLAQYGAMCMFLGEDQPYQLSPAGIKPIGDAVASLLQDFAIWNDGLYPDAGLYGSIVEIEGEKHYLIGFSSNDPTLANNALRKTLIYDCNIKSGAWMTWTYAGVTMTCPIYQSYDEQTMQGTGSTLLIDRDNLLLIGLATTVSGASQSVLGQVFAGQALANVVASGTRIAAENLSIQFRAECPAIGKSQTNRGVAIEYENVPVLSGTSANISLVISGQPDPVSGTPPASNAFAVSLPYYPLSAAVPPSAVLTALCQPSGVTALDTIGTMLAISVAPETSFVRIIKVDINGETTKGTMQ